MRKSSKRGSAIDETNPDPEAAVRGFRRRTSRPPPPDAFLKPYEVLLEDFLSQISRSVSARPPPGKGQ